MPQRRGFSVIELLVIIALLLLLAAFLLPAVGKVRFAATRAQSQNNLRQMALAVHNFHDSNGRMPPALGKSNNVDATAHFFLLPYIEQQALYQKGAGEPWKNGVFSTVIPVYLDPSDSSAPEKVYQGWLATTNYAANWLALRTGDKTFVNITDGTSNTFLFATRYQMCNGQPTAWGYSEIYPWAPIFAFYSTAKFQLSPSQEQCDPTLAQSIGNAINVGICDGSVRSLSPAISPRTWHLLCDPNDGHPIGDDFNSRHLRFAFTMFGRMRCTMRRGFSVIELLVILAILLILIGFLLPAVQKVRQAAARTQSSNNLKQLNLAVHNYNDVHKKLPPTAGKAGNALFHLLPYIEADNLFREAKGNSWSVAGNVHPLFLDPQDASAPDHLYLKTIALTNYVASWRGFRDGNMSIPGSFPDGTSNTMIFTTRYQICNNTPTAWAYPDLYTWTPMFAYYSNAKFQAGPTQSQCDPHLAQGYAYGIQIGLCDGSVRIASTALSPLTWQCLIEPADGLALEDF